MNSSPKSMLLIDRDPVLRKSSASLLRELGHPDVYLAGDGTEGWAIVKKYSVGMIISSWNLLPEMSGLGLLKIIRADATHAPTPFILMVEEITKAQVIEAGEAGVTDIILKPFTKDRLAKKLDNALHADEDPEIAAASALMNQGQELMKKGRYDEALTTFKRVLNVQQTAEAYYNLGYIKTAQGRYEEAILAFRRATQINNTFAQAYQKMGEVYSRMGRMEEAQKCFELAAEIYMEKNMDENAEQIYMKALEINPNTLNVYNSLGILYRRQGKHDDSIRMYRKALRVNPQDENIHYNLARALLDIKSYDEAASILTRAIEINPNFPQARALLRSIEGAVTAGTNNSTADTKQ